jgi:hypothetical protein
MAIPNPTSINSINNELFITTYNGIYKTDKSLNIVNSYIRTNAKYYNIYHNTTSDILYVTSQTSSRIDLFDRNLNFISSISLTNQPWGLTEKNGKLYVGLLGGNITVIENNIVVKTFPTLCTASVVAIIIDTNEFMGVLCNSSPAMFYLYSTNGSYTGKSITTALAPRYVNYDLDGKLIIAGYYSIKLYN